MQANNSRATLSAQSSGTPSASTISSSGKYKMHATVRNFTLKHTFLLSSYIDGDPGCWLLVEMAKKRSNSLLIILGILIFVKAYQTDL
uniref:Uncharacterized protein n=1 Tax=Glossina brevipalpis TaxID=37001 RepID=A0A1A9W8T7_9MUSC